MTLEQIRKLKEQRAQLIEEQRRAFDAAEKAGEAMSPEALEENEKRQGEIVRLQRQAEQAEALREMISDAAEDDARDAAEGRSTPSTGQGGDAQPKSNYLKRFAVGGIEALTPEERRELNAGSQTIDQIAGKDDQLAQDLRDMGVTTGLPCLELRRPTGPELRKMILAQMADQRALSTGTANLGSEFVPEGFWPILTEALKHFSGPRRMRTNVFETATGNLIPIATSNDTGNEGELVAEAAATTEQDPATDETSIGAHKYSSKRVKSSLELLQDSAFDLERYLARILGERLGRITARHNTVGNGTTQPQGFVTGAATFAAAAAASVSLDDAIKLEHSLDEAYRVQAEYTMNDSTGEKFRLLKDGDGNYMLKTSDIPGRKDTLNGYNITYNPYMADVAADAKSIAFGDFSYFWIRDVLAMQLFRLSEKYIESGQIGWIAFMRTDSRLVDAGTNPIKVLTHPSS